MKRTLVVGICLAFALSACEQNAPQQTAQEPSAPGTAATPPAPAVPVSAGAAASTGFDIAAIPVSTQHIGDFPYLSAPAGYKYEEKKKPYEEKYFFYHDTLVTKVAGKYFHATVSAVGSQEFSDTYVVSSYKQAIEKLGGVEIFSGDIPPKAVILLEKEKPAYAKDLYDARPYQYKQFVLRKPDETVWIELIHGLNSNQIDLTVMREQQLQSSVQVLKATEIEQQLAQAGKAVLHLNFDTDKAVLQPEGEIAVAEIAQVLQQDPALRLSIEGHTDNTGDASHNQTLSTARAQAVLARLAALKIASNRLQAIGYGATKPLAANNTEANKAQNRRVELVKL